MKFCNSLENHQQDSPDDLAYCHDIGLHHFWKAKNEHNEDQAVFHWKKVIANWSMVLENDSYWKNWGDERGLIYEKKVTKDHTDTVREDLKEKIIQELTDSLPCEATNKSHHLKAAFFLEIKAIQLLRQLKHITLISNEDQKKRFIGPLQLKFLSTDTQITYQSPVEHLDLSVNSQNSLALIQFFSHTNQELQFENALTRELQCRFCFSELGIPMVYLEIEDPLSALDALYGIRCIDCEPRNDRCQYDPNVAEKIPTLCNARCERFDKFNPSYRSAKDRQKRFFNDTVMLMIGANLSLAYQTLLDESEHADNPVDYIKTALDLSQIIDQNNLIDLELSDMILKWVEGLKLSQRYDTAISLLERIQDIKNDSRFTGKLAGLLNIRGVQKAEEERWQDSLADLRRAFHLNPFVSIFRQNLKNVLESYASVSYKRGDYPLYNDLMAESLEVSQYQAPDPVQKQPSERVPLKDDPFSTENEIFSKKELFNPMLFDDSGNLNFDMFDESGKQIMATALEIAISRNESLIGIPALFSALLTGDNGELKHLLSLQGIRTRRLKDRLEKQRKRSWESEPLGPESGLSQFNLWFDVLHVLDLAWNISRFENEKIHGSHIFYGLLISHKITNMLEDEGADVNQILENAGWRK